MISFIGWFNTSLVNIWWTKPGQMGVKFKNVLAYLES